MHLPGHLRDRFGELVDEACESGRLPAKVGYMYRYRAKTVSTGRFLHLFSWCDDIVPKACRLRSAPVSLSPWRDSRRPLLRLLPIRCPLPRSTLCPGSQEPPQNDFCVPWSDP